MSVLSSGLNKKAILIVDDAPSMRALLSATLKNFGFNCIYEAKDGIEAERILQKKSIELIFCDWEMPNKDGLQLFKELQQNELLKQIPFVLVTSMAELEKVKIAIDAGVKEYIAKPYKEGVLLEKVKKVLASEKPATS